MGDADQQTSLIRSVTRELSVMALIGRVIERRSRLIENAATVWRAPRMIVLDAPIVEGAGRIAGTDRIEGG
jgi:hypothetical protein